MEVTTFPLSILPPHLDSRRRCSQMDDAYLVFAAGSLRRFYEFYE